MPTIAESDEGASPWQQLLYAAKTDSVELAQTCLAGGELDINKADGLGMTGACGRIAQSRAAAGGIGMQPC